MNSTNKTAKIERYAMKNKVRIGLMILGLMSLNANIFAQTNVHPYSTEGYTDTLGTSGAGTEKLIASIQPFASPMDLNSEWQAKNDVVQSKLSNLWTYVTLNMITADVLSLYIPESIDEFTELADGKEADIMMAAAVMYQIPISMVLLSKVLPYKANRLANMIAAGMMTAAIIGGGSTDAHYIVCAGAEVVGLSLIAWNAWKWADPEGKSNDKKHALSLNLNADKKAYGLTYNFNF
ncbi:DUF6326 family protein [Candidatus Neomarinimicrobiota bacterium]